MHPEALTEKGKELFPLLRSFADFYLAGGTALALQIGHRVSADFDLFSDHEIPQELFSETKKVFTGREIAVSVQNPDELTVFVDEIKMTFLHYPFPVLGKKVFLDGLACLSVPEIAATKAYTIGRRGSFKDYADLYFILSGQYSSLADIADLAKKKYGGEFNGRLFLEQLLWFDDVADTEIIFLKPTVGKGQIKQLFEGKIRELRIE